MPDVVDKLSELGGSGMELSLACTEWFLTLFASPCVKEVTVQIWDSIFLFGDEVGRLLSISGYSIRWRILTFLFIVRYYFVLHWP